MGAVETGKRSDEFWMRRALELARSAGEAGEVPVGAVLVRGDEEIACAENERERSGDPTAHAETLALRRGAERTGSGNLSGCTLYVSLEPCPMCAGALEHAHIGKVVYAADDPKNGFMRYGNMLHPKTKIVTGIMKDECLALLTDFFKKKR